MYALKRTTDGLFVAKPGREKSYTNRIEHAQTFDTIEEARANSCQENEYPVEVKI